MPEYNLHADTSRYRRRTEAKSLRERAGLPLRQRFVHSSSNTRELMLMSSLEANNHHNHDENDFYLVDNEANDRK
jgi:hypothetical protein